jgi:hypothetical protein
MQINKFIVRWARADENGWRSFHNAGPFETYEKAEDFLCTKVPLATELGDGGYRLIELLTNPAEFPVLRSAEG